MYRSAIDDSNTYYDHNQTINFVKKKKNCFLERTFGRTDTSHKIRERITLPIYQEKHLRTSSKKWHVNDDTDFDTLFQESACTTK